MEQPGGTQPKHTHTHTHDGMSPYSRACLARRIESTLRRGGLQQVWTVAWAKRGKVVVVWALQFSRTNFSHGIWVLHRHPKSIGCAHWLGFVQAEGKMRLDLSLTYGGEEGGFTLQTQTILHFICWVQSLRTNLSKHKWQIGLFKAHWVAQAPVMIAETEERED